MKALYILDKPMCTTQQAKHSDCSPWLTGISV